jgi:RHS repeat-associated protein
MILKHECALDARSAAMMLFAACAASLSSPRSRNTGKERDAESGNDYFDARYYSSAMGRFMSPDWSAQEQPVPYATLDNPQTLNLYSYMRNNPLGGTDPDGHSPDGWQRFWNGLAGYGKVTDAERDARIEEQRQWLINKFAGNDATKDYFQNAGGKAIFAAYGCAQSASCLQNAISAGQVVLSAVAVAFGDGKLAHIYDRHAGDFGLSAGIRGHDTYSLEF